MNVTKISGIKIRHLQVIDLPSLRDFKHPEVRRPEIVYGFTGLKHELYEDFGLLDDAVNNAVSDAELKNDPLETYSVAVNKSGEVVGFALTGGTMMYTVMEGRSRKIPDIHYVYVHPDYRKKGIGMAMCETLMHHHTFLRVSGVSELGSALADKLIKNYGHPEGRDVIRHPKR